MTAEAIKARQAALQFEAKKHELRQLQNGEWKITLTIHPNDMPDAIMKAAMGTRYVIAAVEVSEDETPVVHEKESRKWEDLKPSQQAGIRCNEPLFQTWIVEEFGGARDTSAVSIVRRECGVTSRSELNTNDVAKMQWERMDHDFQVWQNTPDL